jgi:ABC-type transport system substrate-binding protein
VHCRFASGCILIRVNYCIFQLPTIQGNKMKRISLIAALLALALSACGQKAAETDAPAAAPTVAAVVVVAAPAATSAVVDPAAAPAPAASEEKKN